MDFLKNAVSGDNKGESNQQSQPTENSSSRNAGGGGLFSGIGDKFNSAAGGGKESEKNEDLLDKGTSDAATPLLMPLQAQQTPQSLLK